MGGGLVLFGIGGDVSGGLFDAFSDSRSGGGGSDVIEDRIEDNKERASQPGPRQEAALADLVRDYASLASAKLTGEEPDVEGATEDYAEVVRYWERYERLADPPDPAAATYAVQAYQAVQKPERALEVAQVLAERDNSTNSYLTLMDIAAQAGNTRIRDLAASKALDLAGPGERPTVRQRIQAAKQPQTTPGTSTTPGGG
jgi:hypothetical protein